MDLEQRPDTRFEELIAAVYRTREVMLKPLVQGQGPSGLVKARLFNAKRRDCGNGRSATNAPFVCLELVSGRLTRIITLTGGDSSVLAQRPRMVMWALHLSACRHQESKYRNACAGL